MLTIGHPTQAFSITHQGSNDLTINDGARQWKIALSISVADPETASGSDTFIPSVKGATPVGLLTPAAWTVKDGPAPTPLTPANAGGAPGISLTTRGSGTEYAVLGGAHYDGSDSTLQLRVKVSAAENLSKLRVELSNNNWTTVASDDLLDAMTPASDGQWLTISLGRGEALSGKGAGYWAQYGRSTFDWSKIDGLRLAVEAETGVPPVTVELSQLEAVPAQSKGKVVIVFDDGSSTILPAAAYLHKLGMPANVAVIAKYVELPSRHYLNVFQLRKLQNKWGWNMVNHTFFHVDGVVTYVDGKNLSGYLDDVASGAQFLETTGLNSAPNWFIYPHGDTDDAMKHIIGEMYKFARTTQSEPETYPFGDRLAVTTLEVQSLSDAETGADGILTPPSQVGEALADTKRFGNTLILTFHRIHSRPSDAWSLVDPGAATLIPTGYPLSDFKIIANEIKASGLPVLTFSGLDRSNGIPEDNYVHVNPGHPSQIVLHVTGTMTQSSSSLWSTLTGWL